MKTRSLKLGFDHSADSIAEAIIVNGEHLSLDKSRAHTLWPKATQLLESLSEAGGRGIGILMLANSVFASDVEDAEMPLFANMVGFFFTASSDQKLMKTVQGILELKGPVSEYLERYSKKVRAELFSGEVDTDSFSASNEEEMESLITILTLVEYGCVSCAIGKMEDPEFQMKALLYSLKGGLEEL